VERIVIDSCVQEWVKLWVALKGMKNESYKKHQ